MNILLVTPLYSQHFDAGHFWLKALNKLGHAVVVWDYRLTPYPAFPNRNYRLCLVMKGEGLRPDFIPRPCFCYWPDAFFRDPGIEDRLRQYDKVFTPVRPTPDWMEWLPTGFDPDIHRDLNILRTVKSIYVGTNNSDYKWAMMDSIAPGAVYGNGWGSIQNSHNPVYLHDFVKVANETKILLDIHHDPCYGLNRKIFECCAMGFTLVDQVPGVVDLFGPELAAQVSFKTAEQAKELFRFYICNPEKRRELWSLQLKAIQPYSYLEAAKKILTYLK